MNWYGHVRKMNDKRLPKKNGMVSTWKMKKRKPWKFVHTGSNNWNERDGNYQHGMNRQGNNEEENKILGTERCKNIDSRYTMYLKY